MSQAPLIGPHRDVVCPRSMSPKRDVLPPSVRPGTHLHRNQGEGTKTDCTEGRQLWMNSANAPFSNQNPKQEPRRVCGVPDVRATDPGGNGGHNQPSQEDCNRISINDRVRFRNPASPPPE